MIEDIKVKVGDVTVVSYDIKLCILTLSGGGQKTPTMKNRINQFCADNGIQLMKKLTMVPSLLF